MKKLLPILLGVTLLLNSCIKDDMDACAGYMHIYFSYIYGGANRFFETVSTPTQLHFYKQKHKYRELEIAVDEIGLTEPYRFLKNFDDTDSLELIAWTQDEAIDYVDTPDTPIGEGYVKIKEITDGSGICRPVDAPVVRTHCHRCRFARKSQYCNHSVCTCCVPYTYNDDSSDSRGSGR